MREQAIFSDWNKATRNQGTCKPVEQGDMVMVKFLCGEGEQRKDYKQTQELDPAPHPRCEILNSLNSG
jgi:hypothetical protein